MDQIAALFVRFARDERGATAIEYGFIAALLSLATVAVIGQIGIRVNDLTSSVLPGLQ